MLWGLLIVVAALAAGHRPSSGTWVSVVVAPLALEHRLKSQDIVAFVALWHGIFPGSGVELGF